MIYHSLEEVFAAKRGALSKIRGAIGDLAPDQARVHPPGGGWSPAEILEHLCLVESQGLRLIESLLKKTEAAGKTHPSTSPFEISVQPFYERSLAEKYSARDQFLPTGSVAPANSLRCLEQVQEQLFGLGVRLQSIDLAFASFPHWYFGRLTLGQWLAFIGLHEERHVTQMMSISRS